MSWLKITTLVLRFEKEKEKTLFLLCFLCCGWCEVVARRRGCGWRVVVECRRLVLFVCIMLL